jgi:O-antigen/teichoic acid export membrane protein
MEVKKEALRGVKWTSLSTVITVAIQLLQTAVLARILGPEDYGLMALGNIAIGFASIFLDMGISYAIISKPQISHQQLSSLYWLNIIIGTILFIVVSSSSPLIAQFYEQEELVPIIILASITFISSSFSIQYNALLSKNLRFDTISKITIFSQGITFSVSIILALNNFGVYSLVLAYLCSSICNSALLIITGRKLHKPSFTFSFNGIREFINFGAFQMGERSLNYFNTQFDSIIIGKILGAEILGVYTLAKNLTTKPVDIINPIITKVTIPIMSKISHDTVYLKKIYTKTLDYLCAINFPLYGMFFLLAEPIILFLYGPKWTEAIPLFRLLSIYFLLRSTFNPIGSLLIAKGKANWGFYWNLSQFAFMPLAIWAGSQISINGVIYGLILVMLLGIFPLYKFMIAKLLPMTFIEYLKIILTPLLFVFISCIASASIIYLFSDALIQLILTGALFCLVYLLSTYLFNKNLFNEFLNFRKG